MNRRVIAVLAGMIILAGCTVPKPTEDIFAAAEQAIAQAEAAGADEHSPVEMRFAREKLAEARKGMETREYEVASYLIEQSEINAELAIARTRAALQRNRVNELTKALDVLRTDLEATYGEGFQQ